MTEQINTPLVRGVVAGQEDAWNRLVRLYSPSLDRFMTRCGVLESDRENLRNDVFADAFRGREAFVGQNRSKSFLKWLWVIARRRVQRFIDSERRRPDRASGGNDASERLANLSNVPIEPSADEQAELLREILNDLDLPEGDSELLKLYYMDNLTAIQVGERLEMTDAAVRQKVARLLRRIREQTDGLEPW